MSDLNRICHRQTLRRRQAQSYRLGYFINGGMRDAAAKNEGFRAKEGGLGQSDGVV